MGRPKIPIDASKVEQLACFGCSAAEIAAELNCGERTIERRFGAVLKSGAKKRDVRLRSAMFKYAVRGNPQLLIFLGKVCLGMKEDPTTTISVSANATSNAPPVYSPEQREKLAELAASVMARAAAHRSGNGQEPPPDRLGLVS